LYLHVVELEDLVKDVVGGREAGGHVVVRVRQVSLWQRHAMIRHAMTMVDLVRKVVSEVVITAQAVLT
jgi:hypothetical protein